MAVVVGAPDVDHPVEAALSELVVVVGDVGGKVGGHPVGAHQHVVFFGAVLGGFIPDGAFFFVGETALFHQVDDLLYAAVLVQDALFEPHVVVDAVFGQIVF